MAAPNIVGVTTITGKTDVQNVGTGATAIVTNAAASGQVLKVNSLVVSNIDGTNAADITVDLFRGAAAYRLTSTVTVPPNATLVVISKDTGIYMEEGDTLRCTASAAGDLQAICSYDIITDV
jgi:hypothetical protein